VDDARVVAGKSVRVRLGCKWTRPLLWCAPTRWVAAESIYSLIGNAKLNGLDPEAYLRYVLERVAGHPINNRIDALLPWNVASHVARVPLEA
jgi:hypothetical protein